ncbi:MAG: lysophospholipid acyltransferase family protein [Gammaproteobacteria bacterium]
MTVIEYSEPALDDIDPQFYSYLRNPPRLSYTNPDDSWIKRQLVSSLEVMFGRNKIESVYYRLKDNNFSIQSFFEAALAEANIKVRYDLEKLNAIPQHGPLMFVANHPFGVVDGVILCDLALKARGDFRILLNSLLCQDRQLAPFFLPIDFEDSRDAVKTNIRSKQLALQHLSRDVPVLIFPSGMVSTAGKFGFGSVVDAPWTTFAAKIIREANATVVPIYFHGRNSRKFHLASHIAKPLRMALLVHEALRMFGQQIDVTIGDPIGWSELESFGGRVALTSHLYGRVQALGDTAGAR